MKGKEDKMKKITKFMKLVMVSIMAFSQLGTSVKVLADTINESNSMELTLNSVTNLSTGYVDHISLDYGNGDFEETVTNDGIVSDINYDVVLASSYTYLDGSNETFSDTIVKTGSELNGSNSYDFTYGKFNFNGTFNLIFKVLRSGVELYSEEISSIIIANSNGIRGILSGESDILPIDNVYNVSSAWTYKQVLVVNSGDLSPDKVYSVSVNDNYIGIYTGNDVINQRFDGTTLDLSDVFGGEYTYTDTVMLVDTNDSNSVYTYNYDAVIEYDSNNDDMLYDLTGLDFYNGYLVLKAKNFDNNLDILKVSDLLNRFNQSNIDVIVKDSEGNVIEDDTELKNGYQVCLTKGLSISYEVVVLGDATFDNVFDRDDLSSSIDGYLNNDSLPSMDVYEEDEDEEIGTITFGDIVVLNDMLRENSIVDYEDNADLSLVLSDIPSNVFVGESFDVNMIINSSLVSDYIDGIDALVSVNDKLELTSVTFNSALTGNYKDNHFVGVGDTLYNGDTLVTLTFTAISVGSGSGSVIGQISKVNDIYDFEELGFDIQVIRNISSNNDLASLNSNVGTFDRDFDKDTISYVLTVPYDTKSVILSGSAFDVYASVDGLIEYEFVDDEKTVSVVVTAEDGSTKIYTVKIVRDAKPVVNSISYVYSSNNYLKELTIDGYDIDFDKDVNEYTIKVDSDVKFLDIKAVAEDSRARVEITGNENFKTGNNIVTITVTAENGDVNVYELTINKKESKKSAVTLTDDSSNTAEKVVIIVLIVLVVLGLLYLIFKKDEDEEVATVKNNSNKDKK